MDSALRGCFLNGRNGLIECLPCCIAVLGFNGGQDILCEVFYPGAPNLVIQPSFDVLLVSFNS